MKTLPFIFVLFLSVSSYGKNIPGPFWYSLSERILAETHQLFSLDETPVKPVAKAKAKKVKVTGTILKCQPKKSTLIPNPFPAPVKATTTQIEAE